MRYDVISADCHVDLCWLPPDLFTASASSGLRDRMPYVTDGPNGRVWTTKRGASLGLMNGMGSAGRQYVPGRIHRADRMAATGLYEDGKRGIRRLTDPDLRVKDQDRDGVQAEVLYGVLGAASRLNDPEAAVEVTRVYNEWLAGFCAARPERFAGLASIPNHPIEAAIAEVKRVAKRGVLRGLDIANSPDLKPLWDPYWNPLWEVINDTGLPLHFHTISGYMPEHIRKIVSIGSDPTRAEPPRHAGGGAAGGARRGRVQHHGIPDQHGQHLDLDDLQRRSRALSADQARARRVGHRLDPVRAVADGRGVGGPVPGPYDQDAAERLLEAPVLGDLPD